MYEILEDHYRNQRHKYVKRMSWRAGDVFAAEDVVQEAYARAMKYYGSFTGDIEDFGRWYNTIANNCLREFKNAEKGYSPVEAEPEEESYDCIGQHKHRMRDLFRLIETKTPAHVEVLTLYFKQEYNAKSISEITQYSYAMCHQIIFRFRNELREIYRE